MAKVPFSKLQAKVDGGVTKNFYYNLAGEEIYYEVKHYLPFEEKLELVSRIINQSIDDNGFYNPMRVKYNMVLEIVYAYTNLSFTEKMKEDPFKLYDTLVSTGIFTDIIDVIREKDWKEIQENVWTTIKNIYDYRNSAMGILSFIASDYSAVEMDANKIQELLANSENLELLKQVVTKLG
jgi:hypothetical protein